MKRPIILMHKMFPRRPDSAPSVWEGNGRGEIGRSANLTLYCIPARSGIFGRRWNLAKPPLKDPIPQSKALHLFAPGRPKLGYNGPRLEPACREEEVCARMPTPCDGAG